MTTGLPRTSRPVDLHQPERRTPRQRTLGAVQSVVLIAIALVSLVPLAAIEGARFIELAPGRTLAGLMKRINRRLPVESLGS